MPFLTNIYNLQPTNRCFVGLMQFYKTLVISMWCGIFFKLFEICNFPGAKDSWEIPYYNYMLLDNNF